MFFLINTYYNLREKAMYLKKKKSCIHCDLGWNDIIKVL